VRLLRRRGRDARFRHVEAPDGPLDGVPMLTFFLLLLLGLPAPLVVGPMGGAGAPASLVALGGAFFWCWYRVVREPDSVYSQPVKTAGFLLLLTVLVVYASAMLRAIPPDEVSVADMAMLRVLAMVGLVLLANDGASTYDRLHTLIRRLATGVGLVALLALAQFFTGQQWVDRISIPGLTWSTNNPAMVLERDGMSRAAGTATSPIELGVVLGMMLPLLITLVLNSRGRQRAFYVATTFAAAFALFLTVSRSALITAAVAIAFMLPAWTGTIRRYVLAAGVVMLGTVYVAVPGLLRTFQALFMGMENDPSTQSRTDSYAFAAQFVERSPLLGRGVGTFLPGYRIFDNEYLLFLVEAGALGLLAWIGLLVTAVLAARRARLLARTDLDRQTAQALGAAVAAGALGGVFFDLFGFQVVAGLLFLAIGLCGACLELARRAAAEEGPPVRTLVAASPRAGGARDAGRVTEHA
jgi:O-antigen ligase